MNPSVLEQFEKAGAFLSGHFELSSGKHSNRYLQCALVLQDPIRSESFARQLADRFQKKGATVVIGPALGGVILSYEVARQLGVRAIFAERQEGQFKLRRGFQIQAGEKVLVVEDVVTTGGSTQEVIQLVRALGGVVLGVGALVDRSNGTVQFGVPFESLATLQIESFDKNTCPSCKERLPITKPGSRTRA